MPRGNRSGNPQNLTRAGMGRPKGAKNKVTILRKDILTMALGALESIGGQRAFEKWAQDHRAAFMKTIVSLIQKEERVEVNSQPENSISQYDFSLLTDSELETLHGILCKVAKPKA